MPLMRLVYYSSREDRSAGSLDTLLRAARFHNAVEGITGALVATPEHFLQLIEGRREHIGSCLERIIRDPRHSGVKIVCAADAEDRLFLGWSMHIVQASRLEDLPLGTYPMNDRLLPSHLPQSAIEEAFRRLAAETRADPKDETRAASTA